MVFLFFSLGFVMDGFIGNEHTASLVNALICK